MAGFFTRFMHILYKQLWLRSHGLCSDEKEHVLALYVDKQMQEIATCLLGSGTKDSCQIHPRDIFRIAVQLQAYAVILGHTHPSGNLEASEEDITATETLIRAGHVLRIPFLGHAVLTTTGWKCIETRRKQLRKSSIDAIIQ